MAGMPDAVTLRPGGPDDVVELLAMFDDAVAWLSGRGQGAQWGTEPWSTVPSRVEYVRATLTDEESWVAQIGGRVAGALVLAGRAPAYVPPAGEPELYVRLLITARAFAGRGVGGVLLAHARGEARRRDVRLLRVDCWAGGGGRLVDYYTGAGFTPTVTFDRDGWPGQLLEERLTP